MLEVIDARGSTAPVHIPRPRPGGRAAEVDDAVGAIVEEVRRRGDDAIVDLTSRFDGVRLDSESLRVEEGIIAKAPSLVRPEVVEALEFLSGRLRRTCLRQRPETWIDRSEDLLVGELVRPLRRVGIYVPGRRVAYASAVIMAAIPAAIAGVEGVAVCSPPRSNGEIADVVLAACAVAGVEEVYRIGGAQAVAALAYGTESVRPVEKVVGPGNAYVTAAKRRVRGWVGTDSDAGPAEIAVVADDTADPRAVAADLVAHAEHGALGSHVLVTWSSDLTDAVLEMLELEVLAHRDAELLENTLVEGGSAVLVRDVEQAFETVAALAPAHLELLLPNAEDYLDLVRNAGAVSVGTYSPASGLGYVAGTNEVLPTGGTARWASGLGTGDFVTRIYVSGTDRKGLERVAPHVAALAEGEGLPGHERAVRLRTGP